MADGPVQCVLFVLQLQKFVKAEGNVEVWLMCSVYVVRVTATEVCEG